jgi:CheY-like chemotaxis protein
MTCRIIIVEDDRILCLLLKTLLKRMGYDVIGVVDNAEAALQIVNAGLPDVVLMDIKIEGHLDGIETMREIKKIADVPVIYTSGNSDSSTLNRAKEIGYNAFLVKPVIESELRNEIEKIVNSKN